jgi:O-antigen/teichoic acid export membrane protein
VTKAVPAPDARPAGGRPVVRRPAGPRRLLDATLAHLRNPLFLNAYALGISGVVTSGLGVVYWAVAARLYPPDVVGVNAALLSLVMLLANVAQLNLRSGFGRFVPSAGARTERLVRAGYAAALGLALVSGVGVVVLLAVAPGLLSDVMLTPQLAWLFPLTVVLWTAFTVQDHALVALRRTAIVPLENAAFAVAKILLLFPLASVATAYGILVSWVLPVAAGVAVVSGWLLLRHVPHRQRLAEGSPAVAGQAEASAGEIVRYVGWDYLGSLFAIGSASILPVLVLAMLGAAASAHFYIVSTIAMATQLVPSVLATSLFVEVAADRADFDADGGRVARQIAVMLGPIVLVLLLFADPILGIFGPDYAAEGATALRLLALAGIPFALITLAFVRLRLQGRVRLVVVAQAMLAVLLIVPGLVVLPVLGVTGLGAVVLVSHTLVAAVLSWAGLRPLLLGMLGRTRVTAGLSGPTAPRRARRPDSR